MLLGNFSLANKSPGREIGLAGTNPYSGWKDSSPRAIFNLSESNVTSVTNTASMPNGYRDEYQWLLAPKAGGLSSAQVKGVGTMTSSGQNGLFTTADLAGLGLISDAAAGLIVEMVATIAGLGGLTADIIGQLEAQATLAGSGTLTAAQSALAGMTATLLGTGLLSDAQQEALGEMTADIYVNQSQATVQEIVDAVWNALAAEYNLTGTMGEAMNGAGSAGNPWITDLSSYNTANTAGKILKDRLSKVQYLGLK